MMPNHKHILKVHFNKNQSISHHQTYKLSEDKIKLLRMILMRKLAKLKISILKVGIKIMEFNKQIITITF